MNPYNVLDLPISATFDEIKQKYKHLAQYHHPDKGGDEEVFKQIKLAYEILSDPVRRQQYDKTGKINALPSIRSEAIEQLSQMLFRQIPGLNADFDDLILKMKVEVNQMKHDMKVNSENCSFAISNLNRIKDRVRLKSEGENLLQGLINNQIESKQNELAEYARRTLVIELMGEILENYHYGMQEWVAVIGGNTNTI